jgi:hypothetical protein
VGSAGGGRQPQRPLLFARPGEEDEDDTGNAGNGDGGDGGGRAKVSESMVNDEACRMFAKQSFQYYTKPLAECAMITEGEFCNSVEELTRYVCVGVLAVMITDMVVAILSWACI